MFVYTYGCFYRQMCLIEYYLYMSALFMYVCVVLVCRRTSMFALCLMAFAIPGMAYDTLIWDRIGHKLSELIFITTFLLGHLHTPSYV